MAFSSSFLRLSNKSLCRHKATPSRNPFLTNFNRSQSTAPVSSKQLSESFINGTSAVYVEHMFNNWKKDPKSVHLSWDTYFRNIEKGAGPGDAHALPPFLAGGVNPPKQGQVPKDAVKGSINDTLKLYLLARSFQVVGHRMADLDPLKIQTPTVPPELTLEYYGFSEKDLDRVFFVGDFLSGFFSGGNSQVTLRHLYERLNQTYSGSIGIEFMHIQDRERCNWLRSKFETPRKHQYDRETKINIYDRLMFADTFEQFLATKYPATKRFGLEGCESLIPGLKALIDHAADLGVEDVVIGMPHRGRLNVLANVVRRPLTSIFADFAGKSIDEDDSFSGDVKYHLGTSYDRPTRSGKKVHLSLVANPSHLDTVDPVVNGKVRAKQYYSKDFERSKSLSLLLHGDAAFAAQGVIYECFDLAGLHHFETGGTIHIIVNNQIGFTTDPKDNRAGLYCTDVAKTIEAPILHVNGDDPEAVVYCMQLAIEWRQQFKKDIVVDIICYRKHGHNEIDPPDFTQPLMYQKIAQQRSTLDQYSEKLKKEEVLTEQLQKDLQDKITDILERNFQDSKKQHTKASDWLEGKWVGIKSPKDVSKIQATGVKIEQLKKIGAALCQVPEGFRLHKNLERLIKQKEKMISSGQGLDWATAEALAFGSLLEEGVHVRLSGQDVERGTFSHRHSVLHDQKTNDKYVPLNNISSQQETFEVTNSSLSEYAVLGFELGYSLENPNALVLWEAQFGDFANGAQVIIDTFLGGGEKKWHRQTGLVLLLPHGYEGQGPEHSSARLERFLQLCDSNPNVFPEMDQAVRRQIQQANLQVVNCTTPANYFHVLRRQIRREFRKPLVVMSPKSLLRHKLAVSSLDEFDEQNGDIRFKRVIGETDSSISSSPDQVERLVFCSGKVYYDIYEERQKHNLKNVAVVRLEQLSPFPFDKVLEQANKYPNAQLIWAQEEPQNMGAWMFVQQHFCTAIPKKGRDMKYVGRDPSAATATGSNLKHKEQQERLVSAALNIPRSATHGQSTQSGQMAPSS
eukprot:TRINITY_DN703_c0_g2_i1.p1 TRINITY_DN703_c0_g2~~TRINITY_DN703_c0_g2_i1.p1  ORF type:complete len:1022 (+),score=246.03 TRINITY_DN703_c0_g2_i1:105-3170(+)